MNKISNFQNKRAIITSNVVGTLTYVKSSSSGEPPIKNRRSSLRKECPTGLHV